MDRAVVVLLGRRDVILEAAGHGAVGAVDDAECAVALVHRADDDTEAEDVGELAQRQELALHLAEDRERAFFAAIDLGLDAVLDELLHELLLDGLQDAAGFGMELGETVDDDLVGVGVQHLEGDVLQLVPHRLHAHAACQGCVDVHRLLRDAHPLLRSHMLEGSHVVQAVGELDQQHAHVARHGEKELPQVLGLGGFLGDEVELGDLGQAIDEGGNLGAELLLDFRFRRLGILDRVVKKGSGNGGRVELHLGQDGGDFQRVVEIGFPRGALLVAMRLHGIDIGPVEEVLIRIGVVLGDPLDKLVLTHHDVILARFNRLASVVWADATMAHGIPSHGGGPDNGKGRTPGPGLEIRNCRKLSSRCAGCRGFRPGACPRVRAAGPLRSSVPSRRPLRRRR